MCDGAKEEMVGLGDKVVELRGFWLVVEERLGKESRSGVWVKNSLFCRIKNL